MGLIFCNCYKIKSEFKNRRDILQILQKSTRYFAVKNRLDIFVKFYKNWLDILLLKNQVGFFSWKSTHQKYA